MQFHIFNLPITCFQCAAADEISSKHDYAGPPYGGGFGGPPYGGGLGHGGGFGLGGGGIGIKDVTLVQPVAIKPVGPPISAIPLEPFKAQYGSPYPPSPPILGGLGPGYPSYPGKGFGKQIYAPPPSAHSKSIVPPYHPKPFGGGLGGLPGPSYGGGGGGLGGLPGPSYGGGGGGLGGLQGPAYGGGKPFIAGGPGSIGLGSPIGGGGKVVEHVHHHIHHTPGSGGTSYKIP